MGNCLVEKLVGTVNNDNLLVFNKLVVDVEAMSSEDYNSASNRIDIYKNPNKDSITVKIVGDGTFLNNDSKEYTISGVGEALRLSNGTYKVYVNKSDCIYIQRETTSTETTNWKINFDKLQYDDVLTGCNLHHTSTCGDIKNLGKWNLEKSELGIVRLDNTLVTGKLEELVEEYIKNHYLNPITFDVRTNSYITINENKRSTYYQINVISASKFNIKYRDLANPTYPEWNLVDGVWVVSIITTPEEL